MTDSEPPPGSPPGASAGLPRVAQMVIMIGAGAVLAVGGCALAIQGAFNSEVWFLLFGVAFCAGVLTFIGGFIGLFLKKASPLKLLGFAVLALIGLFLALLVLGPIFGALLGIGS